MVQDGVNFWRLLLKDMIKKGKCLFYYRMQIIFENILIFLIKISTTLHVAGFISIRIVSSIEFEKEKVSSCDALIKIICSELRLNFPIIIIIRID